MSLIISFTSEYDHDVGVAVPVEEIQSISSGGSQDSCRDSCRDEPAEPAMDGVFIRTRHDFYFVPGGNLKKCVEAWAAALVAGKSALATGLSGDNAEEKKEACCCGHSEACDECVPPKDDAEEKEPHAGQGTTTSTINIQAHVDDSSTTSTWTAGFQHDMIDRVERVRRRTKLAASMLQFQSELDALREAESLLEREEAEIRRLLASRS